MARAKKLAYDPQLIDDYVAKKAEYSKLEKECNDLRERILAIGLSVINGHNTILGVVSLSRRTIDTAQLKIDFGADWYNSYCKETQYYELRVLSNGN
jgi:hypothetical protein